ncbi:TonB-dependent receptor family protein [Biformimicrobium ophioploci]|uniref:TonB-dependent receptor n=1 Tax=Biformimicrobium ophioploci TaxID=3036711 RepID=A0ABQ6LVC5_9GAMM|nr:TonB-dependent receptor [Microbulbifer sp. NKW57]GMG86040.1 TonB-dependent receptor [Microbulbifer sp. NKW57]
MSSKGLLPNPLALAIVSLITAPAMAATTSIETLTVIGDSKNIEKLSGSAQVLSAEELEKFEYADINRILRQVPGVYLQEEDGYGLRPNISIRGSGSERSDKVTLMEDGVMIAPAPYGNPSAYYFPTSGRISAVEVMKGPGTLKFGPATVGGAVNLISTPIPEVEDGRVQLEAGQNGEYRLHAHYGAQTDRSGWLVETHQQYADGFREIDRAGTADIEKEDYMVKGRLKSAADAKYAQQLDIKLQYSEENSGMSYMGLSEADFNRDPNRRYGLTALDNMYNRHSGIQLNHSIALSDDFSLNSLAYYNKFKRDWFKVGGLGSLIDAANSGDLDAQAQLDGTMDLDGIGIKHNNRSYISKGIELNANWNFVQGDANHDVTFGVRRHWDETDRFQPTEVFNQVNGALVFDSVTAPSSSNNRIEYADANSFFAIDQVEVGEQWVVTAALRYEDYSSSQERFGDPARTGIDSKRSNDTSEWLPGLGAVYKLNEQVSLLAGVHRGFAPPSAGSKEGLDAELSTNYEYGARFDLGAYSGELIGFYSDYESATQNCSFAVPCAGDLTSGSIELGKAEIKGVEAQLQRTFVLGNNWSLPLSATYTFTDAELTEGVDGAELGNADNFIYLPENQLALTAGIDSGAEWQLNMIASYVDEMCTEKSCGNSLERTESYWVLDMAASYDFSPATQAYFKVDNLLDDQAIITRSPDGARANKPRTATVGVKFTF